MASSLNRVQLIGNLGKDPEVRNTQDGKDVVNLSLATSEVWRDKVTGEKKERTEWHKVVIFASPLVGIAKSYLRKGSKVYIEGSLQTRRWTDQMGHEKYTTEIILQPYHGVMLLLDAKTGDRIIAEQKSTSHLASDRTNSEYVNEDIVDDEIPF